MNLCFGSMSFPLLTLLAEGELTTNHQKWSFTFWMGQLTLLVRRKMNELDHRILALLAPVRKAGAVLYQLSYHKPKIFQFSVSLGLLSCAIQTKPVRKRKILLWSSEMIIIITSKITNFTAAFHGLYLLAAHSLSLQFLFFSFWVEHVENVLGTTQNKLCYPGGKKYIAENITWQYISFQIQKTLFCYW